MGPPCEDLLDLVLGESLGVGLAGVVLLDGPELLDDLLDLLLGESLAGDLAGVELLDGLLDGPELLDGLGAAGSASIGNLIGLWHDMRMTWLGGGMARGGTC